MPNFLDFTEHTKKRKGRPATVNVGADRSKYFKQWAEKNPEKIEKYRLKQRIRNRENAILRMKLEIEGIKSILERNDNGTEENEETGAGIS